MFCGMLVGTTNIVTKELVLLDRNTHTVYMLYIQKQLSGDSHYDTACAAIAGASNVSHYLNKLRKKMIHIPNMNNINNSTLANVLHVKIQHNCF